MSRGGVALTITIVIVACISWSIGKSNEEKQSRTTTMVQHSSSRDKYGLLASNYDRNGWARVNGKWVSNPRTGAVVKYSSSQVRATSSQRAANTVTSSTHSNTSEYANIERTLRRVADNWQKIDVNNDGLNNCIDAAVLFYQYYPDKSKVCIMLNYNRKTGMNHLFNCVFTDGVWKAIEPQAYYSDNSNYSYNSNYLMGAIWGSKYDRSYNRDVTADYLRYVR